MEVPGRTPARLGAVPASPGISSRPGNDELRRIALDYIANHGRKLGVGHYQITPRRKLDLRGSLGAADAFDAMPHSPQDPATRAAYDALIRETIGQYNHLTSHGYKIEPWVQPGQPYANSRDMMRDVAGKHIWFFPTVSPIDQATFGEGVGDLDPNHNPMVRKTGHVVNGMELRANDLFRAVHDIYGHALEGHEFGPEGELNAWAEHAKLFSPMALRALTTETHGQNSWVNFGRHIRRPDGSIPMRGEPDWVHPMARPFAEQKAGILPDEVHPRHPYVLPAEAQMKLRRLGKKIRLGGLSDIHGVAHGYLENPMDTAYRNILSDALQDYDHPSFPVYDWYHNKALPAIAQVKPVTGHLSSDAINQHRDVRRESGRDFRDSLLKTVTLHDDNFPLAPESQISPLMSTALFRALTLPRFRGTFLKAFEKRMPSIAEKIHRLVVARELVSMGIVRGPDAEKYTHPEGYSPHRVPRDTVESIADALNPGEYPGITDSLRAFEDRGTGSTRTGYHGGYFYGNQFIMPTVDNSFPSIPAQHRHEATVSKGVQALGTSAKEHFNPTPPPEPKQLAQDPGRQPVRLAEIPPELQALAHGYVENPRDIAYRNVISDYAQETGHPSYPIFDWYYNKALPAVAKVDYKDFPKGPLDDPANHAARQGARMVADESLREAISNHLPVIEQHNLTATITDPRQHYAPTRLTPLIGSSLIRALALPRFRGTYLQALYKRMPKVAHQVHQWLVAKELQTMGLLSLHTLPHIPLDDAHRAALTPVQRMTQRTGDPHLNVSIFHDQSSSRNNPEYDGRHRRLPVTGSPASFESVLKIMHTANKGATAFADSAREHFPAKEPKQLSRETSSPAESLFHGDLHGFIMYPSTRQKDDDNPWEPLRESFDRIFAKEAGQPPSDHGTPLSHQTDPMGRLKVLQFSLPSSMHGSRRPDPLRFELASSMLYRPDHRRFMTQADITTREHTGNRRPSPEDYQHVHGLSSWEHHAEPAMVTVFKNPVDPNHLKSIGESVGAWARQHGVLAFHPHEDGKDQLLHMRVRTHHPSLALDPQTIGNATKRVADVFNSMASRDRKLGAREKHLISSRHVLPDTTGHSDVLVWVAPWEHDTKKNYGRNPAMIREQFARATKILGEQARHEFGTDETPMPNYWHGTGMRIGGSSPYSDEETSALSDWEKTRPSTLVEKILAPHRVPQQLSREPMRLAGDNPFWINRLRAHMRAQQSRATEFHYSQLGQTGNPIAQQLPTAQHAPASQRVFPNSQLLGIIRAILARAPQSVDYAKPASHPNPGSLPYAQPVPTATAPPAMGGPRGIRAAAPPVRGGHVPLGIPQPAKISTPAPASPVYPQKSPQMSPQSSAMPSQANQPRTLAHPVGQTGLPIARQVLPGTLVRSFPGKPRTAAPYSPPVLPPLPKNGVRVNNHPAKYSREPVQLGGLSDIEGVAHGYIENPQDTAYRNILSDALQDYDHPSFPIYHWYHNKAIPAVQEVNYRDMPKTAAYASGVFSTARAGLDYFDRLPEVHQYPFDDVPRVFRDNTEWSNRDKLIPLATTALMNGLVLPRFQGTFINALYKRMPKVAENVHKWLVLKELQTMGILDTSRMRVPLHDGPTSDVLYRVRSATMKTLPTVNGIQEFAGIANAHRSRPGFLTGRHTPTPIGDPSEATRNQQNSAIYHATGNIAHSIAETFGHSKAPEKLSREPTQFDRAPAGTGAVVRGVFYPPGKMVPKLETLPGAPKPPAPPQPTQPAGIDVPKPVAPPRPAIGASTRTPWVMRAVNAAKKKRPQPLQFAFPGESNSYDHLTVPMPSHILVHRDHAPAIREQWKATVPNIPFEHAHKLLGLDAAHPLQLMPNHGNGLGVNLRLMAHPLIEEHNVSIMPRYGEESPSAYIESLVGRPGKRGKGTGAGIFANQAKFMSDAGFHHVNLFAARGVGDGTRYNGFHVWPRFGFDASVQQIVHPELRKLIARDWPHVSTIQQLIHEPGGLQWWEKNGNSMPMSFDLRPGSESMRALGEYLQGKGRPMEAFNRPPVRTKLILPASMSPMTTSQSSTETSPAGSPSGGGNISDRVPGQPLNQWQTLAQELRRLVRKLPE